MTNGPQSKGPGIPAWQKNTPGGTSGSSRNTSTDTGRGNPAQDRSALLEQAKIFLEDPSVRNASQEKKVAFLEEKGLQDNEIAKVLDKASALPASSAEENTNLKTVHDSSSPSSSTTPSSSAPYTSTPDTLPPTPLSPQAKSATHSNRDTPPIITYPEFLLQPTKPPPLVTFARLTYALYTLAGISAVTYGASKHLVQPMLESLTSARHDLSGTALRNAERLNEELERNVSHIPAISNSALLGERRRREREGARHSPDDDETGSDAETIDSDPTELFHRDIATQTSPELLTRSLSIGSRRSRSSSSSSSAHPSKDATATTTAQSRRLTALATSLSSLLPPTTPENTSSSNETLLETISDCQSYLDKLRFSTNSFGDYNLLYGSAPPIKDFRSSTGGRSGGKEGAAAGGSAGGTERRENVEDEAMRFRQEIRAVKGALLSVRNFPAGRPATGAAGVAAGGGGDMEVGVSVR